MPKLEIPERIASEAQGTPFRRFGDARLAAA
jgi:hypothetical protein